VIVDPLQSCFVVSEDFFFGAGGRRKLRLKALGIWLGLEDSRLTIVQLSSAWQLGSFGGFAFSWMKWVARERPTSRLLQTEPPIKSSINWRHSDVSPGQMMSLKFTMRITTLRLLLDRFWPYACCFSWKCVCHATTVWESLAHPLEIYCVGLESVSSGRYVVSLSLGPLVLLTILFSLIFY